MRNDFKNKSSINYDEYWYDLFRDWDLIEASFLQQYGIRLRHTDLTYDEFYTIMKGAGRDNSVMNMSRSSFRNKNNNDIYVKKSNNPNISDNI